MKSRARRAVSWLVVWLVLLSISLLAFLWTKEAGAARRPRGSIVANAGSNRVGVGFNAAVTLNGAQSQPSSGGGTVRCRWRQIHGTPVTLSDPDSCTPTFTTPPPNAHLETYWYVEGPGTVNRSRRGIELTSWRVIPFSRRQKVLEFELTVMDNNTIEGEGDELLGADTATMRVFIDPNGAVKGAVKDPNGPGEVSGGQNTVAVGTRVYLNGATSEGAGTNWSSSLTTTQVGGQDGTNDAVTGWSWTLAERPAGSQAQLQNPLTQTPILVPDVAGRYVINYAVTAVGDIPAIYPDLNNNGRRGGDGLITDPPASMVIMAGQWVGVGGIGGVTSAAPQCSFCHIRSVVTQEGETIPPILPLWKKTGHASILQRGLDDLLDTTYQASCIACHSVGFNPAPQAKNGGWDDLALSLKFKFPKLPAVGTFRQLLSKTPDLAQRASVQCENCHGPGSNHSGDPEGITRSQDPTVCAQCHDAPDQGYNIFQQYRNGRMGYDVHVLSQNVSSIVGFSPCQKCHSSQGHIQMTVKGLGPLPIGNLARVGCPTCHDPHDATNENQLRISSEDAVVELFDGTLVSGGKGTVCMTCHRMPIVAIKNPAGVMGYIDAYLAGATVIPGTTTPISDAFILLRTMPTNTEMLAGTGGYEFPGERYARSFHYENPNTCVTCHMFPSPGPGQPGHNRVGGHTFNVRSPEELTGTNINEEGGERVENVAACQQCHATLKTLNRRARGDYDGDGQIEGVQDEIVGLIALVKAAPGYFTGTITRSTPLAQVAARWNVVFVEYEGSRGIHNTAYAVTLLQRSYKKLTGNEIPRAAVIFKREPYSTTP